ncbi:MAG: hypothetical protein GYB33_07740 [Gammaproteobacteria bacterium]|nr:hypothetical protein [Gammaproteobacteria bacterium]
MEIDKLYGLDDVSFAEQSQELKLVYNASRLCLDKSEVVLVKHYLDISHDWWAQSKEGYYKFIDGSVKNYDVC